jgi:hypothetical protein
LHEQRFGEISEPLFIFVGLSQLSATSAKQKTTRYAGGRQ